MKILRTTIATTAAIALCAGLLGRMPDVVLADNVEFGAQSLCEIAYVAEDGDEWLVSDCPVIDNTTTTLAGGLYAVVDDVTLDGELIVEGDARLIVANDRTLFAPYGIRVRRGAKLTVYGQTNASGTLAVCGGITEWDGSVAYADGEMVADGMMAEDAPQPSDVPAWQANVAAGFFAVEPTCDVIALDHEPAEDEVAELLTSPELTPALLNSAYLWILPSEQPEVEEPTEAADAYVLEEQDPADVALEDAVPEEAYEEASSEDEAPASDPALEEELGEGSETDPEDVPGEDAPNADDLDSAAGWEAGESQEGDPAQSAGDADKDVDLGDEVELGEDGQAEDELADEQEAQEDDAASIAREDEGEDANLVTVTFDANGGSGTMDPITVPAGETFQLPECGFEPPEGYVFSQWSLGNPGSNVSVPSSMTVRAWWAEGEDDAASGGSTTDDGSSSNAESQKDDEPSAGPAESQSGSGTTDTGASDSSSASTTQTTSSTESTTSSSPQTGDPQGSLHSILALMATGIASLILSVRARRME